ncbi:unnamed protein product, partial [Rotaria sp. Silwood2]
NIVTSSAVLSERDANENEKLYNLFDIFDSHNTSKDVNQRRIEYEKQTVYRDVSSFQHDYFLKRSYGKRILGDRYENGRKNIVIDEVYSMLFDKGNCVLYLPP